jgi:hypothetical protein
VAWDTAVNVLNDAAIELGLYHTNLDDPYDSTDPAVRQLCRLLKGLGQDLLRDHSWTHLQKVYTFSTVISTASYALPTDFARLKDGTEWNRSSQWRLFAQAPRTWQLLSARSAAGLTQVAFRIYGDLFYFNPAPTAVYTMAYEYQSRYWVDAGGGSTPDAEAPTDGADTLFFDRRLLVAGLKLYWLEGKGFDTVAAQRRFDEALARAKGSDGAAPQLNLAAQVETDRLIDETNAPATGFGFDGSGGLF